MLNEKRLGDGSHKPSSGHSVLEMLFESGYIMR